MKVGRVLNQFKVGKHFKLTIEDNRFEWQRKQDAIKKEAGLDGIYVIRTSEPAKRLSAENVVRSYKQLADVELAFRWLKSLDLLVRPIRHRLEDRVKAHVFVCMLAYYVQWHLKQAWAPLLFVDEHLAEHRAERDPVSAGRTGRRSESEKSDPPDRRRSRVAELPDVASRVGHAMPQHVRVRRGGVDRQFQQTHRSQPAAVRGIPLA